MTKWTNLCWNKIDWKRVKFRNGRLQRQIYNASFFGNQKKVLFLQSILICSFDAKLLAVQNFETQARYLGVNQKFYSDASFKFRLAQKLKLEQKGDTLPFVPGDANSSRKQGHIEQKQSSKTIQDSMKQFWILMALEPQWKPLFESNSYGFRLSQNKHYTIKYLLNILDARSFPEGPGSRARSAGNGEISERFILKVDLRKCFNHMDPNYLLSQLHIPLIIKNQIQTWLKTGILFKMLDSVFPGGNTIEMTHEAHPIGPFLRTVALHGIEQNLKLKDGRTKRSTDMPSSKIQRSSHREEAKFVRYLDNFVIIHPDKEIVLAAKNEILRWLKLNWGIKDFHEANISIQSSREGFVFLGFRLIHIKGPAKTYRTKIYPSKKNQKEVIKKIGDFCRKNRSISTYDLISILSPIILNWANDFRFSECKAVFRKMDFLIFQILRAWVFRRDPRHGRMAIKPKYFPEGRTYLFDQRKYSDNWVLVGRRKLKNGKIDEKFLPKMAWVQSLKYASLQTSRGYPRDTPL